MGNRQSTFGRSNEPVLDQQRIRPTPRVYGGLIELPPFSYGGTISEAVESSGYAIRVPVYVNRLAVTLRTLGSTLAFDVVVDGFSVQSVNVTSAGLSLVSAALSLDRDSVLSMLLTDIGDGASSDLTVVCRCGAAP